MNQAPAGVHPARSLGALTVREWLRLSRQPSRIVAAIGTPLLIWIVLAGGFAQSADVSSQGAAGMLPGAISLTVIFSAIFGAISLIDDRNQGYLRAVLATPTPGWVIGGSKLLGAGGLAMIQGAALLPLAAVVGARPEPLGWLHAMGALAVMAVFATGLSLVLAWRVNSVAGFHGVMNLILMPMWLLSGAIFPLSTAAGWMRLVMLANPMAWMTDTLHAALTGQAAAISWGWPAACSAAALTLISGCAVVGRRAVA